MPRTPRSARKSSVFPSAQIIRSKIALAQAHLSDLRKLLRFLVRLEKLHAEVEGATAAPLRTPVPTEIQEEGE